MGVYVYDSSQKSDFIFLRYGFIRPAAESRKRNRKEGRSVALGSTYTCRGTNYPTITLLYNNVAPPQLLLVVIGFAS